MIADSLAGVDERGTGERPVFRVAEERQGEERQGVQVWGTVLRIALTHVVLRSPTPARDAV